MAGGDPSPHWEPMAIPTFPPSRGSRCSVAALMLAAGLAAGCAAARPRDEGPTTADVEIDPRTGGPVLRTLEGQLLTVQAPPEVRAELARLPGARVRVAPAPREGTIRVPGYVLLDPGDALAPYLGEVVATADRVLVRDPGTGAELLVQGPVARDLRRLAGAKVWVTGHLVGPGRLEVVHYGILRPAPDP